MSSTILQFTPHARAIATLIDMDDLPADCVWVSIDYEAPGQLSITLHHSDPTRSERPGVAQMLVEFRDRAVNMYTWDEDAFPDGEPMKHTLVDDTDSVKGIPQ